MNLYVRPFDARAADYSALDSNRHELTVAFMAALRERVAARFRPLEKRLLSNGVRHSAKRRMSNTAPAGELPDVPSWWGEYDHVAAPLWSSLGAVA